MNLTCFRCQASFDGDQFRGYCPDCVQHYRDVGSRVVRAQRPEPGVYLDGKFTDDPGPHSVQDPIRNRPVCGLCGSEEIESGYGLGSGRGISSYNFCFDCNTFLDCCEDRE